MNNSFICAVIFFLFVINLAAQEKSQTPSILESYQQSREIIERSLSKMGFPNGEKKLNNLSLEISGDIYWIHQALLPNPPYTTTEFKGKFVYDFVQPKVAYESYSTYPGGFINHRRLVRFEKGGFDLDFRRKSHRDFPNSSPEDLRYFFDRLPHLVLERILERPATLRLGGQAIYKNVPHVKILGLYGNNQITLFFDSKTLLLSKYEYLTSDPYTGDVVQERIFTDYAVVGNFMFPKVWQQKVNGNLNHHYNFQNVKVNSKIDESFFVSDKTLETRTDPIGSATKITEIAKGVYFLEQIVSAYNMLFVEFADFILVVEAPNNSAVCEKAMGLIKKQIPNKRIRFVVPTHHHDDHAGGLRAFISEGATILTTPNNKLFFEAVGRASFTLQPDNLSRKPQNPVIEAISNNKKVIKDERQSVEIYDIGPNPHAQEMLVIYFPESGIIFQGDLLNDLANETTVHFAEWIKKSKLNVKQILGVHSSPKTVIELQKAIENMN